MKKLIRGFLVAVLALGILAAATYVVVRRSGPLTGPQGGLDDWIGRQIIGLVNTYLHPRISFETLDYTYPASVTLHTVTLTAPDGTEVLELERLSLSLAETPRIGEPIRIEELAIEHGRLNLIRDPDSGGFRGLSPFVKAGPDRSFSPEGEPAKQFRLSQVLRFHRIALTDIALRYDPGDGRPPMLLDGISTVLNIEPDQIADEPGWYGFALTIDRGDLMRLATEGRANLDTFVLELDDSQIALTVTPATVFTLPPQIQELLTRHEAAGDFSLQFAGRFPLSDWRDADATLAVRLNDFSVSAGDYRFPIEHLEAHTTAKEGRITVRSLRARLLQGTLSASGALDVSGDSSNAQLEWSAKDLDLRLLLCARVQPDAQNGPTGTPAPPRLAGRLTTAGKATADPADLPQSVSGSGQVQLREATLVWIPVITHLAQAMNIVPAKLGGKRAFNHRADATFTLTGEGVWLDRATAITPLLAARATGLIRYDQTLDLRVNAGVVERVQSLLGKVGEVFGSLTDRLVAYRVTGTIAEPRVRVTLLGGPP